MDHHYPSNDSQPLRRVSCQVSLWTAECQSFPTVHAAEISPPYHGIPRQVPGSAASFPVPDAGAFRIPAARGPCDTAWDGGGRGGLKVFFRGQGRGRGQGHGLVAVAWHTMACGGMLRPRPVASEKTCAVVAVAWSALSGVKGEPHPPIAQPTLLRKFTQASHEEDPRKIYLVRYSAE